MKRFALIALLAGFVSLPSSANNGLTKKCYLNAAKFTQEDVDQSKYDENGFETYKCALAPNKKAVICEVSAYKGNMAAIDTYRVVMNQSCTYSFRVELIGEE